VTSTRRRLPNHSINHSSSNVKNVLLVSAGKKPKAKILFSFLYYAATHKKLTKEP